MSQDRPSASVLPYFEFPQTRYVNDVHLPRFGLPAPVAESGDGTDRPYTEQPPAARCTAGDSKDVSPSNSWNDSTNGGPASIAATGKCTIAATKSTRRRRLPRNYRGDVQTAPTASLTSRSARFAVPMPKRSATVSRSSSVMSPVLPFTERTCGFDQASKSLSSAEK